MKANIIIGHLIWVTLMVISFDTAWSQDQTMIQLKALDHQLRPYPSLSIALNQGPANQVNEKGIAFIEIESSKLPPTTVKVLNSKLEVESWNFSKGILEVVVRPKTYKEVTAILRDQQDKPLPAIKVVYNAREPIEAVSNQQGLISMNIPINHNLSNTDLFVVEGYQLTEKQFNGNHGYIKLLPIPRVTKSKNINTVATLNEPDQEVNTIDSFQKFNFNYLDSIKSLTVFYAVIKSVNVAQFGDEMRRRIDEKFYELVASWEDSLNSIHQRQFSITDSSLVQQDVSLLIEQAFREQQSLDRMRDQFDENVELLEMKLIGGGTNLTDEEQLEILEGINKLNAILLENEQKFYQNQARFNSLLNLLKSRLTSIDELEEKLMLSELQREEQSKDFAKKLLTAIAVALALALFGTVSFVLTRKFQKQKNQLSKANAEVKRVNEHLEELVSQRTKQLQETNHELDTFLYKSSHDLRRPLTSIVGLSNIAKMTLKGDAFELFERAADTARNMDRMLRKLINVNEINNPSQYSPIDFSSQIKKTVNELSALIDQKNIKVKSIIQKGIDFNSYPDLIDIILQNLVENALYFSSLDNRNKHPTIKVEVFQENGNVSINLEDNGCGINPAIQDKIWDMFFVGHEMSTGNGLGLYIARKAVKTLQGDIGYKPGNDGKTIFEVRLPVG